MWRSSGRSSKYTRRPLESEPPKKKWIKKATQPKVASVLCGVLTRMCERVDKFLERNLETLKDGGKGALTRSMSRKGGTPPKKAPQLKVGEATTKESTTSTGDVKIDVAGAPAAGTTTFRDAPPPADGDKAAFTKAVDGEKPTAGGDVTA